MGKFRTAYEVDIDGTKVEFRQYAEALDHVFAKTKQPGGKDIANVPKFVSITQHVYAMTEELVEVGGQKRTIDQTEKAVGAGRA